MIQQSKSSRRMSARGWAQCLESSSSALISKFFQSITVLKSFYLAIFGVQVIQSSSFNQIIFNSIAFIFQSVGSHYFQGKSKREEMGKFQEHTGYVLSFLPPFEGIPGFLFYSFMVYMVVLFFGWLLNPSVDKIIADDIKSKSLQEKGAAARKRNLEESRANAAKRK